MNARRRTYAVAAALLLATGGAQANRLADAGVRSSAPATWVATDGRLVAFGAGAAWTVQDGAGAALAEGRLERPVRGGLVAGRRVYLDAEDAIRVVDLEAGAVPAVTVLTGDVLPGAPRVLARALDDLLVWEQGRGLRLFALPLPAGHPPAVAQGCHAAAEPGALRAALPVAGRVVALASAGRTVFAGRDSGVVDVFRLEPEGALVPAGSFPSGGELRALAANGDRLFVLGTRELRVLQLGPDGGAPSRSATYAVEPAAGLAVSGRLVLLASPEDGVRARREDGPAATTHVVTVTSFDFTPQDITINAGDTVEWRCTQGFHDVDSCNVGEPGCTSNATEPFSSGAAKTAPWTYSKTFTLAGPDPYTCTVHAGFGMVGSVTVNAAASNPPAVPDGTDGTNGLRVTKVDAAGATLQVAFDAASCAGGADTRIVGGTDAQLPAAPGGTYGTSVSRCACGTTSPCTWSSVAKPEPGHMLWFVMLTTSAAGVEGSWGTDAAGNERSGPGAGGHSAQCGATARNVVNRCGT